MRIVAFSIYNNTIARHRKELNPENLFRFIIYDSQLFCNVHNLFSFSLYIYIFASYISPTIQTQRKEQ